MESPHKKTERYNGLFRTKIKSTLTYLYIVLCIDESLCWKQQMNF